MGFLSIETLNKSKTSTFFGKM